MKPAVKECNYFGLNHDFVAKIFEGDLTYVGDMCLNAGQTVAVYHAANPNRAKGHKEFMLLQVRGESGVVAGMEREEIKQISLHDAVLCTVCNTILYSVNRHHFHGCGCSNDTFVDGGKDYLRSGGVKAALIKAGTYDVLTKTWTER